MKNLQKKIAAAVILLLAGLGLHINAQSISAGGYHSLSICSNGALWGWGNNNEGQLGDGAYENKMISSELLLSGMGIISVSGGGLHSLFLKNDGTVMASGRNMSGQLGDGGGIDYNAVPVQVSGLTGIIAVSAGDFHSLFLKNDGTVWACGDNSYGQLGDSTTTGRFTPVQVSGLTGITAISAESFHSLFLKNDGTVWACGYNYNGQLGDGTTINRLAPVQVAGLTNVTAIEGGWYHSLFLKTDGTAWACGGNGSGQLGDGTLTSKSTPIQVSGLSGMVKVTGGGLHSLFLKSDGSVWACGNNDEGQLGDNSQTGKTTPIQIPSLIGITAVDAENHHSLFLKNNGTVWACGNNYDAQLGDSTTINRLTPIETAGYGMQVGTISGNSDVCSGTTHTYSISAVSGAVSYTWGVPSGSTITSGQGTTSITITAGTNSGNISVIASNSCGSSLIQSLGIIVSTAIPAQPGTITGNSSVCSATTHTYSISSVSTATNYTWSVPSGAVINSGQGTTSISVTFGTSSSTVNVTANNDCGNSSVRTLGINVNSSTPAQPGTISGNSTLCSGSTNTYSISAASGATSYTWSVPSGATINSGQGTTSISVTFGTNSGNISVIANNGCGSSSSQTKSITVITTVPAQPGSITGNSTLCSGSTNSYSIASVSGATTYTWTVPTGATINSGQGTTSVSVTFGTSSGNVSVTAGNACGNSPARTKAVTVNSAPAQPGSITGTTTLCSGTTHTYSISSVSGATSYTWSVPAGSVINSGQGTTSMNVTFGSSSGNVSVTANNSCGSSSPRTRSITVNLSPKADFAWSSVNLDVSFEDRSTGAASYSWNFGDITTSSLQNPTHTYPSSGTYLVELTITSTSCGTDYFTSSISITDSTSGGNVGVKEVTKEDLIKVFPNPVADNLFIEADLPLLNIKYGIFDITGRNVKAGELKSGGIEMSALRPGVYFIEIGKSSKQIIKFVKE